MIPKRRPVLFVVSAPSGAGKTTLCKRLLEACPELRFSVSATTRSPRSGERDGVDYHFLRREAFEEGIRAGAFLEHADVYGNYYGTPVAPLRAWLAEGASVLLDVDVQGAALIRSALSRDDVSELRRAYADVFIAPPSLESLRVRLIGRGTETDEVIERRMRNAQSEMAQARLYAHQVVNGDVACAFDDLLAVYRAAGLRTAPE